MQNNVLCNFLQEHGMAAGIAVMRVAPHAFVSALADLEINVGLEREEMSQLELDQTNQRASMLITALFRMLVSMSTFDPVTGEHSNTAEDIAAATVEVKALSQEMVNEMSAKAPEALERLEDYLASGPADELAEFMASRAVALLSLILQDEKSTSCAVVSSAEQAEQISRLMNADYSSIH